VSDIPSVSKALVKLSAFSLAANGFLTLGGHARLMSTPTPNGIVIAGGGLAAQRCAETLRRSGYDGPIRMLCAEAHRPYDRPPLSKELLQGTCADDALSFRAQDWYGDHDIELLLGTEATSLEVTDRRVGLSSGETLRYDRLLIATGSRPRTLPMLDGGANVSVLRTLDDATRLREVLGQRPHLAIIGAGFIGQEVAATARRLGAEVTMIEAAPTPLHGILGEQLGSWFSQLHAEEGVTVLTNTSVTAADANGQVNALTVGDGRRIELDHIVVGVGAQPEIEWLRDSGLASGGGVHVDPHGRTAIPDVFAAGDAAATYDAEHRSHVPGSHWEAAGRQGARAAKAMLGLEPGDAPVTSFWTDQYGIRIQYLGRARLADRVELDGDPATRNFTAIFSRAGRPVAALLVDRPRSLPAARKLIQHGGQQ
jgi:NADPH-dependent 2,4-dienoyl-CoA reductase/sulfur reductase-like enzyme